MDNGEVSSWALAMDGHMIRGQRALHQFYISTVSLIFNFSGIFDSVVVGLG